MPAIPEPMTAEQLAAEVYNYDNTMPDNVQNFINAPMQSMGIAPRQIPGQWLMSGDVYPRQGIYYAPAGAREQWEGAHIPPPIYQSSPYATANARMFTDPYGNVTWQALQGFPSRYPHVLSGVPTDPMNVFGLVNRLASAIPIMPMMMPPLMVQRPAVAAAPRATPKAAAPAQSPAPTPVTPQQEQTLWNPKWNEPEPVPGVVPPTQPPIEYWGYAGNQINPTRAAVRGQGPAIPSTVAEIVPPVQQYPMPQSAEPILASMKDLQRK